MVRFRKTVLWMAVCALAASALAGCGGETSKAVELKDFIVNLDEPSGTRYLKLRMKLVLDNAQAVQEVADADAVISDGLISFLSTKRVDDLRSSLGKKVLKKQLIDLFNNKLITKGKVQDIFFINFVIQ